MGGFVLLQQIRGQVTGWRSNGVILWGLRFGFGLSGHMTEHKILHVIAFELLRMIQVSEGA